MNTNLTLEQHRQNFSQRRFLAMPLAGTIAWSMIGIACAFLPAFYQVWCVYLGTGAIFYLGMFFMRLTGEHAVIKSQSKNPFDRLFLMTLAMALLVFAIAIPFAQQDYTALPLGIGILSGIMWLPLSWTISHWVGTFHAVSRTLLVAAAWYAFPEHRFTLIPLIIVLIYLVSIAALEIRWRKLNSPLVAEGIGQAS